MSSFKTYRCLLAFFCLFVFHAAEAQTETQLSAQLDMSDSIYPSLPDSSYAMALKVEKAAIAGKFPKIEARAKSKVGRYLLLKAELEDSEKKLNAAFKLYSDVSDFQGQAYIMRLKAILQGRIGNKKEKRECLERSVELYKKTNDSDGLISSQLNLSLNYIETEDAAKALTILNELKASESHILQSTLYFYYQDWSRYYMLIKDHSSALTYAEKAGVVAKQYNMKDSYITLLTLKAAVYRSMKDYASAEKFLTEAEQLSLNGNFDHELDEVYAELIKIYTAKGTYERAFYYLKRQNDLKEKMYNIEKVNRINSLEKKLQLSEKEKELVQKDLEVEHGQLKYEESKSQNIKLLFAIGLVLLVAAFTFYLYFRTKSLKDKISEQKQSIEEKSKIIEESYKNIKDSIVYSKQLQDATLPTHKTFRSHFPKSFIYYKPKDIVAGDFYWLERVDERLFFAVADCTGHGVPGALVSVVCNNAMNRAVKEFKLTHTGEILDKVRELVIEHFSKSEREVKDGMDIALCCFKYNEKGKVEFTFSGANNPLWIVRKNKDYKSTASKVLGFEINTTLEQEYSILEFAANKQPVGMADKFSPFIEQTIELLPEDSIYAFSDGITDQFGGKEGKKLKRSGFKKMLLNLQETPMEQQGVLLSKMFDGWKDEFEQVDDVCVVGIQI